MPRFPSPEWLAAYLDAINADAEFRDAAQTWEGDVTLVVTGEEDSGVPFDTWAWFDLTGDQVQAREVTPDEGARAAFVISGTYSVWKEVLRGRLDPVKGMTNGRLRLSGDLVAIREQVRAVSAFVRVASRVTTVFPDE